MRLPVRRSRYRRVRADLGSATLLIYLLVRPETSPQLGAAPTEVVPTTAPRTTPRTLRTTSTTTVPTTTTTSRTSSRIAPTQRSRGNCRNVDRSPADIASVDVFNSRNERRDGTARQRIDLDDRVVPRVGTSTTSPLTADRLTGGAHSSLVAVADAGGCGDHLRCDRRRHRCRARAGEARERAQGAARRGAGRARGVRCPAARVWTADGGRSIRDAPHDSR